MRIVYMGTRHLTMPLPYPSLVSPELPLNKIYVPLSNLFLSSISVSYTHVGIGLATSATYSIKAKVYLKPNVRSVVERTNVLQVCQKNTLKNNYKLSFKGV